MARPVPPLVFTARDADDALRLTRSVEALARRLAGDARSIRTGRGIADRHLHDFADRVERAADEMLGRAVRAALGAPRRAA